MSKVLYFDTETTGLDPARHEIVQLAYIVEVDGKEKVARDLLMRPLHPETADPAALDINGRTLEELARYAHPFTQYQTFIGDLAGVIDKYDKTDKAYPAAYNGRFDLDFLSAWFKSLNDPYLGSWINWRLVDPMSLMHWADFLQIDGYCNYENYKLGTVSQKLGVSLTKAHDALSDVAALRDLVHRLSPMLQGSRNPAHES